MAHSNVVIWQLLSLSIGNLVLI